jgi:hypothetical protein
MACVPGGGRSLCLQTQGVLCVQPVEITGHEGCDLFPPIFWADVYWTDVQPKSQTHLLGDSLVIHPEDSAPPLDMNRSQSNAATM